MVSSLSLSPVACYGSNMEPVVNAVFLLCVRSKVVS